MSDRVIIKDTVIAGNVDSATSDNIVLVVGCSFGGNVGLKTPTLCTSLSEFADAFGNNTDTRDVKETSIQPMKDTSELSYIDLTETPIAGTLTIKATIGGTAIDLVDNANGCVVGSITSGTRINMVVGKITGTRVTIITGEVLASVSEVTYQTALEITDENLLGYQYAVSMLTNGFPVLYDSIYDCTTGENAPASAGYIQELRDVVMSIGDDRVNYDFKFVPTMYDILTYNGDTYSTTQSEINNISEVIAKVTELGDRIVVLDINGKSSNDIEKTIAEALPASNSYCTCFGNYGKYSSELMPGSFWYLVRLSDNVTNHGLPIYHPVANQTGYVNMVDPVINYTYMEMMTVGQVQEGKGFNPIGKISRNDGYTIFGNLTCLRDKTHINNPYNLLHARLLVIEVKRLLRRIGLVNLFATNAADVIRQYDILLRNTLSGMRAAGYIDAFDINFTAEGTQVKGTVEITINGTVESVTAGVIATLNTSVVVTD